MDIFGIIYKALNKLSKSVTSLRGAVDKKQNKLTYADGSEITNYQDLFLGIVKEIPIEGTAFLYNKTGCSFQPILEDGSIKGLHNIRKIINIAEPIKGLYYGSKPDVIAVLSLNCAENFQAKNLFQDYHNLLEVRNIINGDYITDITQMFHNCTSLRHVDDYFSDNIINMSYAFFDTDKLKKLPELNTSKVTDFSHTLNSSGATEIPKSWTFDEARTFESFAESSNLIEVKIDSTYATNWYRAFIGCDNLIAININATNAQNCIYLCCGCGKLKNAEMFFETGSNIKIQSLFDECGELETATVDTYNANFDNLSSTFNGCRKLKTIAGVIALGSTCDISYTFYQCYSLENLEGLYFLEDNRITHNYDFRDSPKLTVESMQSIISNLNNQQANLIFNTGAFNKLTPEDIAVATNKGWSVMSAPQN